ncbi:MAG: preprotein translocase subunit TatC, partial [Actinobacteria bacterium]|nr:preprotein translocase subunit TatC [Actinomycetota bacterium]
FKVAFFAAAIVCSPIILWQLLAFFLPALKPSERKWFLPTFGVGVALFIFGMVFCYLIILDPAFDWMLSQTADIAQVLPDATEYIKLIMLFELGFGIAFELPLVVFYLIVFNIVPYKTFRKSWRTVYIILMVICAMVTPDASPVTMALMFGAMAGLYEISLLVSRIVLRKKISMQNDKLAADEMAEKAGLKTTESATAPAKKKA